MEVTASSGDLIAFVCQQLENQRFRAEGLKTLAHALPAETGAYLTDTAGILLADVEAKRRILDRHVLKQGEKQRICAECGGRDWKPEGGVLAPFPWVMPWPCPTIRLLALPHADRPGYQEQWRPS